MEIKIQNFQVIDYGLSTRSTKTSDSRYDAAYEIIEENWNFDTQEELILAPALKPGVKWSDLIASHSKFLIRRQHSGK